MGRGDKILVEGDQDDSHVKRIAEFAVDTVAAAGNVLIDEDEPDLGCLHIRVGFHSGHVVSNVIGSLNPRFGLFGDTMNTAARMESNSAKGRIHCSAVSAKLLREQATEFPIRRRGKITVKGKGTMTTYWVGGQPLDDSSSRRSVAEGPAVKFKLPTIYP
jgi:class 3 adenylate cyclase